MDHKEKVEKMIQEFTKKGIQRKYLAPLGYKVLWKCGIAIAPPLFATFLSLFVYEVLYIATPGVSIVFLASCLTSSSPNYKIIIWVISFSIFYGLCMAIFYRTQAKRMYLPLWKDYLKDEDEGKIKGTTKRKRGALDK